MMKKRLEIRPVSEPRRQAGADPLSNPQADNPLIDPLLEDYIDRLCEPICKKMPPLMTSELCRELRAHLLERIDSRRELGSSYEEALKYTLGQFGEGQDFVAEWTQEWKPALRNIRLCSWQGDILVIALLIFWATVADTLLALLAMKTLDTLTSKYRVYHPFDNTLPPYYTVFETMWLIGIYGLLPAGFGVLIGYRVKYRPILSTLVFLTTVCVITSACCDADIALNFMICVLFGTPSILLGAAWGLRLRNKRRVQKQGNFAPGAHA